MIDIDRVKWSPGKRDYILRRIKELSPWYHSIDLGDGIVTPGRSYDAMWESTSSVIDALDYCDKSVLDIAAWDGYWAFQAEKRGAKQVVSIDARLTGFPNLLFVREILESSVVPLCNVPVQELRNRLQVPGINAGFDIVHHLGLFYHLRDPLLSLAQARSVMNENGYLVLETAFIDDDLNSYMAFNGTLGKFRFYGISDTWAPTKLCLKEILVRSQFEPTLEQYWSIVPPSEAAIKSSTQLPVGRITLLAKAIDDNKLHEADRQKMLGMM